MRAQLIVSALACGLASGSASAQGACGSPNDVLMLYEAALVSPNRCTNFVVLPASVRIAMIKAAQTTVSIFDPGCERERLLLRLRVEAIADNDPAEFCRFNRSVFLDDAILKHFVTGSSSKPRK